MLRDYPNGEPECVGPTPIGGNSETIEVHWDGKVVKYSIVTDAFAYDHSPDIDVYLDLHVALRDALIAEVLAKSSRLDQRNSGIEKEQRITGGTP
jgi:hypothetical protein